MLEQMTPRLAQARLLQAGGERFIELFRHGSLQLEYYRPQGVDRQQPHRRDEVYVIISGRGDFIQQGHCQSVEPGQVLMVPAGKEHRFVNFSDDFATWVLFYGPDGGEQA